MQVASQDNVAVTRVDLLIDGNYFATSTSSSPIFSWNRIPRGQHTLQALAYDAAGNRGTSAIVTVTR